MAAPGTCRGPRGHTPHTAHAHRVHHTHTHTPPTAHHKHTHCTSHTHKPHTIHTPLHTRTHNTPTEIRTRHTHSMHVTHASHAPHAPQRAHCPPTWFEPWEGEGRAEGGAVKDRPSLCREDLRQGLPIVGLRKSCTHSLIKPPPPAEVVASPRWDNNPGSRLRATSQHTLLLPGEEVK